MTVIYTDKCFLQHKTGRHPECPERLAAVHRRLAESKLIDKFERGVIKPADVAQLSLVHGVNYIRSIEERASRGGGRVETDTVMSRDSFDVAARAAGAGIAAVDQVLTGKHQQGVCLVRPPGHHAVPDAAMGFCLFNSIAVAARYAQKQYQLDRVLIVDWDVHHGNGTQDAFYADGNIWFFSAHRSPFYPGTGSADETGTGAGLGTTFNLPLMFGITRRDYLARFEQMLNDVARRCKPDLVLISAGFDAHHADPIGSLGLETEDFATLTQMLQSVASEHCSGRLISLLEGGYDLDALAESVECHLETLRDASGES